MRRSYTVAGHRFSIFMDENDRLWNMTAQYEPFCAMGGPSPGNLFILQEVVELPDYGTGAVPLYGHMELEPGEPRIEVYSILGGYEFRFATSPDGPVVGRMTCFESFHLGFFHVEECAGPSDALFVLNNSAMILYAMASAPLGTVLMHSSVTVKGGWAYMFLGVSGAGKSTHGMMWRKAFGRRARLLNDDNPVVRTGDDGIPVAYGSPWSGKTPCYVNGSAPVRGFAHIVKAPRNEAIPLSPFDAYLRMLPACSCIWPVETLERCVSGTVERICSAVPSIVLECLPDRDAARVCEKALAVAP